MSRDKKQKTFFKPTAKSYGGALLTTRNGRSGPRPLAVKSSMHLVLRSSKAVGEWSFKNHRSKISKILARFSRKYGVKILSKANVGNHIHLHVKLANRHSYMPFIRAITSAIAMTVTGASRWAPMNTLLEGKFWDRRPFTRVVQGLRDSLNLSQYIELNQLEACGMSRSQARYVLAREKDLLDQVGPP